MHTPNHHASPIKTNGVHVTYRYGKRLLRHSNQLVRYKFTPLETLRRSLSYLANGAVRLPGRVTTVPLSSNRWTKPREEAGGGASDGDGLGRRDGGATGEAPCISNTRLKPSQTKDTAEASVVAKGSKHRSSHSSGRLRWTCRLSDSHPNRSTRQEAQEGRLIIADGMSRKYRHSQLLTNRYLQGHGPESLVVVKVLDVFGRFLLQQGLHDSLKRFTPGVAHDSKRFPVLFKNRFTPPRSGNEQ